jgi:hypothetical protein
MNPPNDVCAWRPASGSVVRRANVLGYCRTGIGGWAVTCLIALPVIALWLVAAFGGGVAGEDVSDIYVVRRELRRNSAGRTRKLRLKTWFRGPGIPTVVTWAVSDGEASVSGKTADITFTRGECSVEIFSCPVTRLGNASATVSNGEVTLGVACSAGELELLARVLRWQPTTSSV